MVTNIEITNREGIITMIINHKHHKEIRQLLGVYIILPILWSMSNFLSSESLTIDPVVLFFGLQGYFVYIISREKVKVAQRTIICLISTYLGVSIFNWLNIHEISVTVPTYFFILTVSVAIYAYLRFITKERKD